MLNPDDFDGIEENVEPPEAPADGPAPPGHEDEEALEREAARRRAAELTESTATGPQLGRIPLMANRVGGRVSRLYATGSATYIRLADLPLEHTPQNGYFRLEQTHSNYNALYSLALSAAVNRYELQIRTVDEISPNETAEVQYLVVDWA
jgi:hypothetical protein